MARTLMGRIHCAEHRYADANEQYAAALAIYSKHSDHSYHRAERAELQLRMGEVAGRERNDWDAAAEGLSLAEKARDHPELAASLTKWGCPSWTAPTKICIVGRLRTNSRSGGQCGSSLRVLVI